MKSLFSIQVQWYLHSSNEMQFKIKCILSYSTYPFLWYCAHSWTAAMGMKVGGFRLWAWSYSTVSSISLGGVGCCWCWFFLLSPGSGVGVILMFADVCTLLFPPWSVIACYSRVCVFNIHYILIICSLSLPLELVLLSCKGFFPLISNDWPVLSCA